MTREISGAPEQQPGDVYKPPPEHASKVSNWFTPLDPDNRTATHLRIYKTRIVHFSVEHQHYWDGSWVKVARIDSTDSIHLHVFDRYGTAIVDHQLITEIPPSPAGQTVVHNGYKNADSYIVDNWQEHLRRWSE